MRIKSNHGVFFLNAPFDFSLNLKTKCRERQLAGLDVQSTVKCHSRHNGVLRPQWVCSSGDVSAHLSCQTSKRPRRATGEVGHLSSLCTASSTDCHSPISVSTVKMNSTGHFETKSLVWRFYFDLFCLLDKTCIGNKKKNDRPCRGGEADPMNGMQTTRRIVEFSMVSGLKKGVAWLKEGVTGQRRTEDLEVRNCFLEG